MPESFWLIMLVLMYFCPKFVIFQETFYRTIKSFYAYPGTNEHFSNFSKKSYSEYDYDVFSKNTAWAFGLCFCFIYYLFSKSD